MAEFPSVPFDEAIAALQRRGTHLFPSEHWATVWQEQHQIGFTVARSAGFDILKDIHAALVDTMERGRPFADFKRDLIPVLQKKGWWGSTDTLDPQTGKHRPVQLGSIRRLETIFDTNINVSRAQGRWEQQQETKEAFPCLRYEGVLDSKIRPQHRRWHGIILPIDHPWWKTHYPPNGWKCRCDAVSVSDDDLQRFGWKLSTTPEENMVRWINPASGDVIEVPEGIDPGWAYNPGNVDKAAHAAKVAMDKLIALPPEIGAEALDAMVPILPEAVRAELAGSAVRALVQSGFSIWMDNPQGPFPLAVLLTEDAARIGATTQVAKISPETWAKQQSHHPELTFDDYALAQDAVEEGEKYQQDSNKLAFVLNQTPGVVVIVKATRVGDSLYVTSVRRLSQNDVKRKETIRSLKK